MSDAAAVGPLLRVLLRRLCDLAVLVLGVSTLLFFLLRATGDPAMTLAGAEADARQLAAVRELYGLDRPLPAQYLSYLANLLRLDFGASLVDGAPAITVVLERLPATLGLTAAALLASILLAIPLGLWLGARQDTGGRKLAGALVFVAQGVPGYVVALVAIQLFAVQLGWLPSIGHGTPSTLILPVLTLASFLVPRLARVVAANVAQTLEQDYVRTARAFGASPREVLVRHVLPNALLGATALTGAFVAVLVSGSVVIEVIFGWPGLGSLLVTSTQTLDFPVVQAATVVVALLVFAVNAATDLALTAADPRLGSLRR